MRQKQRNIGKHGKILKYCRRVSKRLSKNNTIHCITENKDKKPASASIGSIRKANPPA